MTSCMSRLSLVDAPSVPSATVMPACSIRATGAMPVPSFRLLSGLCTAIAPRAAMSAMSFSETQMVWAQPVGEQPHPIEMLDHGDAVASRGDLRLHLGLEKMHVDGRVVTLRQVTDAGEHRVATAAGI